LLEVKLAVSIYYQISFVFKGIVNFCYIMFFISRISPRGEAWDTPKLVIEVYAPSQVKCIYVLGLSILPLSEIFLLDFGTVATVVILCFSFLLVYSSVGQSF
jgi:hypothetical protein